MKLRKCKRKQMMRRIKWMRTCSKWMMWSLSLSQRHNRWIIPLAKCWTYAYWSYLSSLTKNVVLSPKPMKSSVWLKAVSSRRSYTSLTRCSYPAIIRITFSSSSSTYAAYVPPMRKLFWIYCGKKCRIRMYPRFYGMWRSVILLVFWHELNLFQ